MTVRWTVRAAELTEQGCARGETFPLSQYVICAKRRYDSFGRKSSNLPGGVQNVLEKRELVSGFPRAAVEIILGRSIKAAHLSKVSGWLQTEVGAGRFGTVSGSAERKPKYFLGKDIMKASVASRRFWRFMFLRFPGVALKICVLGEG